MFPDYADRRYQVFVSSTFHDLQEERQKVLQALLEMRVFPSGMEMFPAADDEQWEFIKREIESSDYYVVIVAGKYGSIAPDGTSFTEKEYDYAVEIGKPVMTFLFHNLDDLKGSHLEPDSARREKLLLFRMKVQRERLVRFYKTPDELKSQVWQALSHAFQLRPQEGWVHGRNSRRIEDLEEIAGLQKRIIDLETENAKLREYTVDPRSRLAQSSDPVEWVLNLKQVKAGQEVLDPPVSKFTFRVAWNELLAACFSKSMPSAALDDVESGLRRLVRVKVTEENPAATQWIRFSDSNALDVERMRQDVRIQFAGLGYVEIRNGLGKEPGPEVWSLTDKGSSQLALLKGFHRPDMQV